MTAWYFQHRIPSLKIAWQRGRVSRRIEQWQKLSLLLSSSSSSPDFVVVDVASIKFQLIYKKFLTVSQFALVDLVPLQHQLLSSSLLKLLLFLDAQPKQGHLYMPRETHFYDMIAEELWMKNYDYYCWCAIIMQSSDVRSISTSHSLRLSLPVLLNVIQFEMWIFWKLVSAPHNNSSARTRISQTHNGFSMVKWFRWKLMWGCGGWTVNIEQLRHIVKGHHI